MNAYAVIDIGGTSVKLLATGQTEPVSLPSGKFLTPAHLLELVNEAASGWQYDAVSIGYPGVVGAQGPRSEPGNLGGGWVGFNFAAAFGRPVRIANESLNAVGSLQVLTVPLPVLILVVLIAVFGILLAKTEFGRNVYLVGGNPEAARLAGINVNKIKVQLFMISGAIAALGGVILAARMNSGQPGAAANVDTDAITAVVLGGIAMTGGTGTMFGTFLGLLVLLTLNNGLLVLGVTTYWQNVAKGVVLVFALALDFYRTKRRNKVKEPPHN